MERVKKRKGLKELPKPCDYFHLIGGTGTGGYVDGKVVVICWNLIVQFPVVRLIAIMLGRLRMSTAEALEHYRSLTSKTFSKVNRKRNGTFKATTLEAAMRQVIRASSEGYNGEEYMIKGSKTTGSGKRYPLILSRTLDRC